MMLQRCNAFLGQIPQCIIFSALESRRENYELNCQETSKKPTFFYLNSVSLLPSELSRIVISCKIVDSSMKFKFLHKISVIQEMFHVFFNLFRGPVSLQHVRGPYTARGRGLCIPVIFDNYCLIIWSLSRVVLIQLE